MTIKERMQELIDRGAVIQLDDPKDSFTLAGALWREDGGSRYLRWVPIFPEHQGHIHHLEYDEVKFANKKRDILFFKDGNMVAGVVPYEESPVDDDDVRETLAEWQLELEAPGNKKQFDRFLETA